MKCTILKITLLILLLNSIPANANDDTDYYKRLYYTAKVWGFVKYFHSEVAKGTVHWDEALLNALKNVKDAGSNQDFNESILAMINSAGQMEIHGDTLPDIADSLKYNLNLNWFDDIMLQKVKNKLYTIKRRFRPQSNYYVSKVWYGSNADFSNDKKYYVPGDTNCPNEALRLLALFRYWNIINYFYPYKNLMDQNWDSTLVEFIPQFVKAKNAIDYNFAFLRLATRLNDSHAITYSNIIDEITGIYSLPLTLKYIEKETVITGNYSNIDAIKTGDIIKSINGIAIQTLRDSLKQYVPGSNEIVIERNVNTRLLEGRNELVTLQLKNATGLKSVEIMRNVYASKYYNLITPQDSIWKKIKHSQYIYGYVDMGRLDVDDIESMFNDLWDTDAIIFDIRNYPNGTLWKMIRFLYYGPIHIANFTVPDIRYPGTIKWISETIGSGNFSRTYDKPIFILFDEDTQSQAEYTVMGFEQHPKAVKVGSQTAAADGNVSIIYLPGGIVTYYTGLGTFYPDNSPTQRIGIIPDIEVHPTIEGIREGKDEVLEAVFDYSLTSSENEIVRIPKYELNQNYPNPFNSVTIISYQLPVNSEVELTIYNLLGQKLATLVNANQPPGNYNIEWDATDFPSGVYFYELKAGSFVKNQKMLLLR